MRSDFKHHDLDDWMLARAPASPAQRVHRDGHRYYNFSCFCMTCGLEELGLVDQSWSERVLSSVSSRTLAVGRRQQSESIEVALDIE